MAEVQATLTIDVPDELRLFVNPAYLESILLNFLTNTIKYRQVDRPLVVTISSEVNASHVILSICDNGRGIDLEKNGASLFGMYKTFHGNADARGIGLFISKYQMDSMGGEIKVTSKVNEGTCFELHFLNH
jgi:signal transduction histidine kinase